MTDHVPTQQMESSHEADESGFRNVVGQRLKSPPWLARAASVGLCSLSIGFVVLFMFVLETGGNLTLFTRPLPLQIALALPYVIGALTLGTAVGAMLAWRYSYWSLPARIHQTGLALLGIAFTWQLSTLGFIAL